jgi:uncharacterized integral membrane protein (TIGR00697 family)
MTEAKKTFKLLLLFIVITVGMLITSNILALRFIEIGPFVLSGGILCFPIVYITSDVLSEVYGYEWSRRSTWYAMLINTAFYGFIALIGLLPAPAFAAESTEKFSILNNSWRIVLASLVSLQAGDWFNDNAFQKLKKWFPKSFATRALGSSVIGNIVDSIAFSLIAFAGIMPLGVMFLSMPVKILIKIGYESLIFPITALVVRKVKAIEGV